MDTKINLELARRVVSRPLLYSEPDIRKAIFYILTTDEETTMEDYWLAKSLLEDR